MNNFGVLMNVFDAREIPIEVGSFVRYSRTGTISEVIAIEEIDNKNWIKLAKTELLYSPEFLEVLDEKDFDWRIREQMMENISYSMRLKEMIIKTKQTSSNVFIPSTSNIEKIFN